MVVENFATHGHPVAQTIAAGIVPRHSGFVDVRARGLANDDQPRGDACAHDRPRAQGQVFRANRAGPGLGQDFFERIRQILKPRRRHQQNKHISHLLARAQDIAGLGSKRTPGHDRHRPGAHRGNGQGKDRQADAQEYQCQPSRNDGGNRRLAHRGHADECRHTVGPGGAHQRHGPGQGRPGDRTRRREHCDHA